MRKDFGYHRVAAFGRSLSRNYRLKFQCFLNAAGRGGFDTVIVNVDSNFRSEFRIVAMYEMVYAFFFCCAILVFWKVEAVVGKFEPGYCSVCLDEVLGLTQKHQQIAMEFCIIDCIAFVCTIPAGTIDA